MASTSELFLGDGGSDGENVSLLQDDGVSAPILPADPEDLPEAPLTVRLKCPLGACYMWSRLLTHTEGWGAPQLCTPEFWSLAGGRGSQSDVVSGDVGG